MITTETRFKLEKGSKKHQCPACGKNRFVRFVDLKNRVYLPNRYGRCDREDNCQYFLDPFQDGFVKSILDQERGIPYLNTQRKTFSHQPVKKVEPPKRAVYFDQSEYQKTLNENYLDSNVFIHNLETRVPYPLDDDDLANVIVMYGIGTIGKGYMSGATTFPFIDIDGKVRAVQIKQFDERNHTIKTNWLHSLIEFRHKQSKQSMPEWLKAYLAQESKASCLFGEHLLSKYPNNPVALVEAPKTAIYGTLYFGDPVNDESMIWLAVFNKSSFSFEKLKVLKGRKVFVFPDLSKDGNTFREWQSKAKDYEKRLPGTRFIFSDFLERMAPQADKEAGKDIADYLIQLDWRELKINV
ncbi:MAG: hypothetical protein KDC49_04195 [Saprospiraceae bacterium]|nr:hypothetical protein [Saprospiraceae bacterium]